MRSQLGDLKYILTRRIAIQPFIIADHRDRIPALLRDVSEWNAPKGALENMKAFNLNLQHQRRHRIRRISNNR